MEEMMVAEWGEEGLREKLKYSALYVVARSRRKQLFGGFVRHVSYTETSPRNHSTHRRERSIYMRLRGNH